MQCVHSKLGKHCDLCPINLKIDLLCPPPLFSFMKEYTLWVQFVFVAVVSLPEKDAIILLLPTNYILLQINLMCFMQNCFELTKLSMKSK